MKLYNVFPTWAFTIASAAAATSVPSAEDRSASLLRNRPAGKFRLTGAKSLNANDFFRNNLQASNPNHAYSTIEGFSCFRDINGMTQAMFDLEKNYPDLVSISDIGDSYLKTVGDPKGHDIYVMEITASTSSSRSQVFFTGGQHARELAPPELLMRFAEELVEGYDKDADITWVLDTTQINIVLYVNPDGRDVAETRHGLLWRKNVNPGNGTCFFGVFDGVDLNRNYDWMWGSTGEATSNNPCDDTYHGSGPESEPEVQALVAYAKTLFPEEQRKEDPVAEIDVPFGENITGIYMDVHAYGGLTLFPWTYANQVSPDNDSLEAFGRKVSYFNGYVLWSAGQPDFLYAAAGVAHDYMYAQLGVAALGLEIGDDFYQDCDVFEDSVVPDNMNTLMYTIKLAKKPNSISKGPDIIDISLTESDGEITVHLDASDSELVNIDGYPSFVTGDQSVAKIELFLDVLPEDLGNNDTVYSLEPSPEKGGKVSAEKTISTKDLSSGRHVLYAVATDSDGYAGPISSVFFNVENAAPVVPSAVLPKKDQKEVLKVTVKVNSHKSALAGSGKNLRYRV